jgi:hypothetical protein
MFCTAHHSPRPVPAAKTAPRHADRRVRSTAPADRTPGQIFTDWASI